MGARSGVRCKGPDRTPECGTAACARTVSVRAPLDGAETRVISLSGGVDWLVTVVARLVSEGKGRGIQDARLVVRIECLTHPSRMMRVATVRARTLRTVDERRLRTLVSVPAARSRYPALGRRPRGGKGGA